MPVPVRIHYMVGNHDWFYHLPRPELSTPCARTVVQHMGLANRHDQPFPHDPAESDELLEVMRRHKVFARHGDIFDPFNFEEDRDASSLGDAIVIELINRFATRGRARAGRRSARWPRCSGLREIDNIRPSAAGAGVDRRPAGADLPASRRAQASEARSGTAWPTSFWSSISSAPAIPGARSISSTACRRLLKFSKRLSIGWASCDRQLAAASCAGRTTARIYQHALAEQDFRNRRAKHIVYGHTHLAESVPLDASYAEGYVLNQIYFNAGTWRRVHRQTIRPGEHEFIAADR